MSYFSSKCVECRCVGALDLCDRCDLCDECCKCSIYHRLSGRAWPDGNHRLVGLEIEHNDPVDMTVWCKRWGGGYHEDGSCGFEAVTPPLAGAHVETCVTELLRAARGVSADETCAVHVHVDARDLEWPAMRRLLRVYAEVETRLFEIGGWHRVDNRHCPPVGRRYLDALHADDPIAAILAVATDDTDVFRKKAEGRHKALNILPWIVGRRTHAPDTTVEFRMHEACLDPKRLVSWAHLCAEIVQFSVTHTESEIASCFSS